MTYYSGGIRVCEKKAIPTPPNANGIDFDCLYDELSHRICLFNKNNPGLDYDTIVCMHNCGL